MKYHETLQLFTYSAAQLKSHHILMMHYVKLLNFSIDIFSLKVYNLRILRGTKAQIKRKEQGAVYLMKKRFQRIVVFLLTAVLLAGIAAGCSNAGDRQKVLRVGMECNYAPYNWSQATPENGAVKISNSNEYANGYDVMMAQKVADATGRRLEIVKTKWEGLAEGVASGKLDAVIAGMSATADRKATVDFTDNYYRATMFALVKKGGKFTDAKTLADLKGAVCTSQQDTIWYDLLKQIPGAKIQPALADVSSMIVSLQSGKCEVLLVDKPTALAAVYANKDLKNIDLGGDKDLKVPEEQMDIAVAVQKGNAELKDSINKALSNISENERSRMMDQAIKDQPLSNGKIPQNDESSFYWIGRMLNEYGVLFLQGAGITLLLALIGTRLHHRPSGRCAAHDSKAEESCQPSGERPLLAAAVPACGLHRNFQRNANDGAGNGALLRFDVRFPHRHDADVCRFLHRVD